MPKTVHEIFFNPGIVRRFEEILQVSHTRTRRERETALFV
jgi:hypothetical protein